MNLRFSLHDFSLNVSSILSSLHQWSSRVIVLTLPNFIAIRGLSSRNQRMQGRLLSMNEALRTCAYKLDAEVVDVASSPEVSNIVCWAADLLHSSARGYDVITGLVETHLSFGPGTEALAISSD
jgi:hypothetical protein